MLDRLNRLITREFENDFDAFLITCETNVRYLTGFTGDSTWLVVDRSGKPTLLSDGRYKIQLSEECGELPAVIRPPGQTLPELLTEYVGDAKLRTLAFEAAHVHVATMQAWASAMPDVEWVSTSDVVEELRQIKDETELKSIRRAVDIAQRAFRSVTAKLSPAMTELDVYYELESTMRALGAEGVSFTPIVGAEPSGSLPHYCPRNVPLADCRTLLIDWGARFEGYCSDLTRTLCRPGSKSPTSDRFEAAYQAVLEAQLAAIDLIADGVESVKVDAAARGVLNKAGFGDAFNHGLGHGFGLEIHEDPRMGPSAKSVLRSGMVVTVEPGVYFENEFGIRIEDDLLVTDTGCEVLSDLPKGLGGKGLDDCPLVM